MMTQTVECRVTAHFSCSNDAAAIQLGTGCRNAVSCHCNAQHCCAGAQVALDTAYHLHEVPEADHTDEEKEEDHGPSTEELIARGQQVHSTFAALVSLETASMSALLKGPTQVVWEQH